MDRLTCCSCDADFLCIMYGSCSSSSSPLLLALGSWLDLRNITICLCLSSCFVSRRH